MKIVAVASIPILLTVSCACTSDNTVKNPTAKDVADNRKNYIPKNDVEGHNYNARLIQSDDPSALIWCTAYPSNPNAAAFTVPIAGKLTSSNKRPKPTTEVDNGDNNTYLYKYNPELPDDQGMYGTSSEYRYGYDPAGNYHDFTNLEMYCTNVPDVIQKQSTKIDITVSSGVDLHTIDAQVQTELKKCRAKDPRPDSPCPAAAALLGLVHSG